MSKYIVKKRQYVDWIAKVNDLGVPQEFIDYCEANNLKQHIKGKKSLSKRRLARGFYLHYINEIIHYDWLHDPHLHERLERIKECVQDPQ